MRINASVRTTVEGEHAPDRNDEYLYYQTLIGTWPMESPAEPIPQSANGGVGAPADQPGYEDHWLDVQTGQTVSA